MARKIKCRLTADEQRATKMFLLAQLQTFLTGETTSNAMIRLAQTHDTIGQAIAQRNRYSSCVSCVKFMLSRLPYHFAKVDEHDVLGKTGA